MAEFSTTKITPTDGVQVPSVSGSTSGYMEMDEVKSYVVGTLPTDVQTNTEDIGENTSDIDGIRGSSQAFDPTASYSAGDYCIYENVLYRFTSAKSAGAWDTAIVAVVDLPTLDGAVTSLKYHLDTSNLIYSYTWSFGSAQFTCTEDCYLIFTGRMQANSNGMMTITINGVTVADVYPQSIVLSVQGFVWTSPLLSAGDSVNIYIESNYSSDLKVFGVK